MTRPHGLLALALAALLPLACRDVTPSQLRITPSLTVKPATASRLVVTMATRHYNLAYLPVTDWETAEASLTPAGGVATVVRLATTRDTATNQRTALFTFDDLEPGAYRLEVRLLSRDPDGTEVALATSVRDPLTLGAGTTAVDLAAELTGQLRRTPTVGSAGSIVEVNPWPPDGPPAMFNGVRGVAAGADGAIYVADTENHMIRRIVVDADGLPRVSLVAGAGINVAQTDGIGQGAFFQRPHGVAVGPDGALYVPGHSHIKRVTLDANGVGTSTNLIGDYPIGFADGAGLNAHFQFPVGVAFDPQGRLYVADYYNHRIRRVTIAGDGVATAETIAGTGAAGTADGAGNLATFREATGIAVDSQGTAYVAEYANNRVRRVKPDGLGGFVVSTIATGISGAYAVALANDTRFYVAARDLGRVVRYDVDGLGATTGTTIPIALGRPQGIAVGPDGAVYVGENANHRVSKLVDTGGGVFVRTTLAGTSGGFTEGSVGVAQFSAPEDVRWVDDSRIYIADTGNHRVRRATRLTADTWRYETVAGTGTLGGADGAGLAATLANPAAMALAPDGSLFVADAGGHRIRRLSFDAGGLATVLTVAGTGVPGAADGAGALATLNGPRGLALAADGALFVADAAGHRIRKLTFDAGGLATVTTVAGTGVAGGANGPGAGATLNGPRGLALAVDGSLYVADAGGHRVRRLTFDAGGLATVATLAGSGVAGGADGPGATATLSGPRGLVVAADGSLYVSEGGGHRIRRMVFDAAGDATVSTLAGTSVAGYAGGHGGVAKFSTPSGLSRDTTGHIYVADTGNNWCRRIEP